jgi:hypothetical protein
LEADVKELSSRKGCCVTFWRCGCEKGVGEPVRERGELRGTLEEGICSVPNKTGNLKFEEDGKTRHNEDHAFLGIIKQVVEKNCRRINDETERLTYHFI